ncbi:Isocitrate dehydrogenase [NAD] subunit, mitochondrial [Quillaja saponaria]|uniref:Isocitrate dehydrogenase [NAD] subunit, mitochondrial n=1 Tax=Quillaja saponaria TaxID=32244 RepID=A0AAD7L7U6_QUISA|nr:Isocitrate dehydrogenase [NAD] subunit, mitochondrial [Quillaja saponaria]
METMHSPLYFEKYEVLVDMNKLPQEVIDSIMKNKVITKFCSELIAKYAYLNNRKKVTAVHKANIMKLADGLFLESCLGSSTMKLLLITAACNLFQSLSNLMLWLVLT